MLAGVLAGTGLLKVEGLLAGGLGNALLSPPVLAVFAAVEIVLALVLAGRHWRVGAWAAVLLSAGFFVGTIVMFLARMDPGGCGCFGRFRAPSTVHLLVAASMLCLASGLAWMAPPGERRRIVA